MRIGIWTAVALLLAACDEPAELPTCGSLGCQVAASGTPDRWSPCFDDVCWCDPPPTVDVWVACSRVPCAAAAPRCPSGMVEGSGAYYEDGAIKTVCYCAPDGT